MGPSVDKAAIPSITKPLGLHNMPLPEVPIPKLQDTTTQDKKETVPPKIVPLQDYVMTLGNIVSLPQDVLDIPANLLGDGNAEKPDDELVVGSGDQPSVKTLPCSIKLRRITATDVAKWQKKKLPDETESVSTRNANGKYNLREKKVNLNQGARPTRATSKPPTYTEPTDESSQDSQIIGTIYSLDRRPIPDEKLEKIVGLSEPPAYRMGAQSYTEAKRRGELPAPPKQTLPGFKANLPKMEQPEGPDVANESTDSDATIIYTPQNSWTEWISKGKLHIKKLSLRKARPTKKGHQLFKCIKCAMMFNTIAELNGHFISKQRKLTCKDCDKMFDKP